METMNELILHFLQDIYYAEKLGVRNLAKVIKAVENDALKQALTEHREQSLSQVERLAAVFDALGRKPRTKKCAAMDGLVEEAAEAMHEAEKGDILDSALLACIQAVEHYEIARYGAMLAWAKSIQLDEGIGVLEEILAEEKAADAKLSTIANTMLNIQAAEQVEEPQPAPKKAGRRKAA